MSPRHEDLEALRREHRAARYPGDLAADLARHRPMTGGPRTSRHVPRWCWGIAGVAAVLALGALLIFNLSGGTNHQDPEGAPPVIAEHGPAISIPTPDAAAPTPEYRPRLVGPRLSPHQLLDRADRQRIAQFTQRPDRPRLRWTPRRFAVPKRPATTPKPSNQTRVPPPLPSKETLT